MMLQNFEKSSNMAKIWEKKNKKPYFRVPVPITKQQQYNLGTTSRVDCWSGSTSEEEPTTQNYLCNLHSGQLCTKMIILPYLDIKSFFLQR